MFVYDSKYEQAEYIADTDWDVRINAEVAHAVVLHSAIGSEMVTGVSWIDTTGTARRYDGVFTLLGQGGSAASRKRTMDIEYPLPFPTPTPFEKAVSEFWKAMEPDVLTFTPPSSGMATIEYKPTMATLKKEAKDVTSIPSSLAVSAEKFAEEMKKMTEAMTTLGSMGTSLAETVPIKPSAAEAYSKLITAPASTAGKWVMTPATAKLAAKSATKKPTTKDKETIEMAVPTTWELVGAVAGITPRMLLHGDPGTGKSYGAQRLGVKDNQKVYSLTLTEETSMALLQGFYVPGVDDEGNERMIWKDGPATLAWREGARLVINEIANASGDVMTYLYAVLDDTESAMITLPNNETIRPAEGFSVIATMNGNPDESLPEAIRDRFPVCLKIEQVHPEAIKRLPTDLQPLARDTALAKDVNRRVSIRSWLAFDHLRKEKGLEIAAHAVFGHRAKDIITSLKINAAK